jgi:hypothetical protein
MRIIRTAFLYPFKDCLVPVSGSFSELSDHFAPFPQFLSSFKAMLLTERRCGSLAAITHPENGEQLPVTAAPTAGTRAARTIRHAIRGDGNMKQILALN